jgi:hypothetical protein
MRDTLRLRWNIVVQLVSWLLVVLTAAAAWGGFHQQVMDLVQRVERQEQNVRGLEDLMMRYFAARP